MTAQDRAGERWGSPTGNVVDVDALAEQLGDLARTLQAEQDTPKLLDGLVAAAVGTIPGTQDAFASRSEQVGLLFASHAAVAFADADPNALDQLALAVTGPDVIGQAKGMLMERCSIDAPRAFALLTRISQQGHRKLRDVAQELVATGRLVGAEEPGPVEGGGR